MKQNTIKMFRKQKLINGHTQEARSRLKALGTHDVVPLIDWCLFIVSTLF